MSDNANMALPPEYQAQLVEAQRRQAMAQALLQRSMGFQGAQSQGPVAAKTSPLTWMANSLSGYLAQQAGDKASKDVLGVQQRYAGDEVKELERLQGLPEDQRLLQGQRSTFPRAQALAKALQDQRAKRLEMFGQATKEVDPGAAANAAISGQLPGSYQAPAPKPITEAKMSDGTPYLVSAGAKGTTTPHFPPKGTNVNIDQTAETAATKAIYGKLPERMEAVTGAAKKAIETAQSAERISALVKDPATITGFGAGPLAGLAGLGAKLGLNGPDAAAKTQALMSELANQTLANVSRLPGAITEKERPFLEMAAAGQISFTAEAIARLADIAKVSAHNTLMGSMREYNSIVSDPAAASAARMWPFPKGWNFQVDPAKYQETGTDTNLYRYIGGNGTPLENPAKVAARPTAPTAGTLSPQEAAELAELRKRFNVRP